jgi:hypothetical protein
VEQSLSGEDNSSHSASHKRPVFHRTRRFTAVFTKTRFLILSAHLSLRLPSVPTETLHSFLIRYMRTTWYGHLTILDSIILIMCDVECQNYLYQK